MKAIMMIILGMVLVLMSAFANSARALMTEGTGGYMPKYVYCFAEGKAMTITPYYGDTRKSIRQFKKNVNE